MLLAIGEEAEHFYYVKNNLIAMSSKGSVCTMLIVWHSVSGVKVTFKRTNLKNIAMRQNDKKELLNTDWLIDQSIRLIDWYFHWLIDWLILSYAYGRSWSSLLFVPLNIPYLYSFQVFSIHHCTMEKFYLCKMSFKKTL